MHGPIRLTLDPRARCPKSPGRKPGDPPASAGGLMDPRRDRLLCAERLLCAAARVMTAADTPVAARPRFGAVSFLHRFGSALNHHVHRRYQPPVGHVR